MLQCLLNMQDHLKACLHVISELLRFRQPLRVANKDKSVEAVIF